MQHTKTIEGGQCFGHYLVVVAYTTTLPGNNRENKMTVFVSERDKKQKCQLLHAIKM